MKTLEFKGASEMVVEVNQMVRQGWQDSDIDSEKESMLEVIANHFSICPECRKAFDLQGGWDGTLQNFANDYLEGTVLADWICENRESLIATDREIISALKASNAEKDKLIAHLMDRVDSLEDQIKAVGGNNAPENY